MTRTGYDVESSGKARFALTKFTVEEFNSFWPGIEEMLDAVPHTWKYWTKDYIRSAVEVGALDVWGIGPPSKAVLIFFTQIGIYPAKKVLLVPWGAGLFDAGMLGLLEATLVKYAQVAGCESIEIRGRPGWDPHFRAVGMKREFVTWTYDVPNARLH